MAKIIEIDTYNLINQQIHKRFINAEHVLELQELVSLDNKPLTRIKLVNGDFMEIKKSVSDITKLIND